MEVPALELGKCSVFILMLFCFSLTSILMDFVD